MSISNLLEPNNLNLFCGSITSENPPPILGKLTITNTSPDGTANININQVDITSHTNDIQFSSNGTPVLYVGENPTNDETYISALGDIRIDTNFVERIRIDKNGISNNNISLTNILGLNGTVLEYKNNLIDSTLVNQALLTTSAPQFAGINLASGGILTTNRIPIRGLIPSGGPIIIFSYVLPANKSIVIGFTLSAYCLTGANTGFSDITYSFKAINNAGSTVGSVGNFNLISESNLSGAYVGNITPSLAVALGNTVSILLTSSLATGNINFGGYLDVCYA